MKTFQLQRDVDVSGVSGTGVVADGCVFPDGVTVVRWRGERRSTVVWPSVEDVEAIHGHGGATRIVWEPQPRWRGERGPELVELPNGANARPLKDKG